MLISSDHPEVHLTLQEECGKPGEPVARLTPLSWTCVRQIFSDQQPVHTNKLFTWLFLSLDGEADVAPSLEQQ